MGRASLYPFFVVISYYTPRRTERTRPAVFPRYTIRTYGKKNKSFPRPFPCVVIAFRVSLLPLWSTEIVLLCRYRPYRVWLLLVAQLINVCLRGWVAIVRIPCIRMLLVEHASPQSTVPFSVPGVAELGFCSDMHGVAVDHTRSTSVGCWK